MIVGFRDRLPLDSSSSSTPCHQPGLTFTDAIQLSFLPLTSVNTTPLPYHLPLYPVTVTTSETRSAIRCVPLKDSCFTFPLVLPQLNTHSLCAALMQDPSALSRRRSDIPTFIQDNNIDITLLTETLPRPAGDEAKIADLAPPGYSVLSFPSSAGGSGAKGGGIAFIISDSLKPHVSTTLSFPVQHPCFEAAQLTLAYNEQLTNFFCIYRPPPSKKEQIL